MGLACFNEMLKIFREELDFRIITIQWIEFFTLIAESGSKGVRIAEAVKILGMTQGNVSRMLKLLSRYHDPVTKKMAGADIYITIRDEDYHHQLRVILSKKGERLAEKLKWAYDNHAKGLRPS